MTCCDVEYFLLNFFHFAVGHYLQSKCCLLLSVLNTRVEYFEANLQKTPLPHGESRQMHCMFLMCSYVVCTCRWSGACAPAFFGCVAHHGK